MFGLRLTVSYEGTAFAGFQEQPGQRTVQGVLQEAAERVAGHPIKLRYASRTDAGVHAQGQVVAFDTERKLTCDRWALALNRYLPVDVGVRTAVACEPGYTPRYDALHKTYRYVLHVGEQRDPLTRLYAWHLGRPLRGRGPADENGRVFYAHRTLDLDAMRAAACALVGLHDFQAFRAADDQRENTQRTIHAFDVIEGLNGNAELIALQVRGSAFMKNMVRILTGTLVEVGLGRMSVEHVAALVQPGAQRSKAGPTAPPHGLTLVEMTLGRTRTK